MSDNVAYDLVEVDNDCDEIIHEARDVNGEFTILKDFFDGGIKVKVHIGHSITRVTRHMV